MGKDKIKRFEENKTFTNVLQPTFEEVFKHDYKLKGRWSSDYWHNENPIVLELGCGKGEYTIALAKKYPEKNFIGIDIKGARFWKGAKTALEYSYKNVAFIRTRIEFIESFFAPNEIQEIWITFPDPRPKIRDAKKRLSSPELLHKYQNVISDNAIIHLKTDSRELHEYTKKLLIHNNIEPIIATSDLYNSGFADEILETRTHYESIFLAENKKITYLTFRLQKSKILESVYGGYDLL